MTAHLFALAKQTYICILYVRMHNHYVHMICIRYTQIYMYARAHTIPHTLYDVHSHDNTQTSLYRISNIRFATLKILLHIPSLHLLPPTAHIYTSIRLNCAVSKCTFLSNLLWKQNERMTNEEEAENVQEEGDNE